MYARDLIDIKQNDWCAAAVYTQTTDVEGEVNGFYTYDREVLKVDAKRVREANEAVINAPLEATVPIVRPSAFHYKDPSAGVRNQLNLYTLRNGDLTMQVTDFGARVISLFAPDRNGNIDDIIVGYGEGEKYVHNTGERFLGARWDVWRTVSEAVDLPLTVSLTICLRTTTDRHCTAAFSV